MARKFDLPGVLVEDEILSRLPMTSLGAVRSTCKEWNALSKNQIFGKAAAARKQLMGFMMMDYRVCSLKFDLDSDLFDPPVIKQVSIFDQIEISQVFHCDGLLLCVIKDNTGLVVWNPYLGQTKWIQPRQKFDSLDVCALGYDNNRNHKILRVFFDYKSVLGYEIYDFSSRLGYMASSTRRVFEGRYLFLAQEKIEWSGDILLCFDFTTERFGPRLFLPCAEENVSLSCVRDEQLAVLHRRLDVGGIVEIWVTDKIDPNAVSWSKFLSRHVNFPVHIYAGSFLFDDEKKIAVIFDLDEPKWTRRTCRYQTAHVIGQDGYVKSVNIGEAPIYLGTPDESGYIPERHCRPLVCSSYYVPSLVQLQIKQPVKG